MGMPFLKTRNLHASIRAKSLAECRRWIEAGADINSLCSSETALNLAIKERCDPICLFLLDHPQLQPNAVDVDGQTALLQAAFYGRLDLAKRLLTLGASINKPSGQGYTPLHAAVLGRRTEVALMLIESGADVNALDEKGWSPLVTATSRINVDVVGALLRGGCDVNKRERSGPSAMEILTAQMLFNQSENQKRLKIMSMLIEHGCDLDVVNDLGRSYLHQAVTFVQPGTACLLMSRGCKVNTKDVHDCTPLHTVVMANDKEMARYLLLYGCDANIPSQTLARDDANSHGLALLGAFYSPNCAYPVEELLPPLVYATDLSGSKGLDIFEAIESTSGKFECRKELALNCMREVRERGLLYACVRLVRDLLGKGGPPRKNILEKIDSLPLPYFVKKLLTLGIDYRKQNPWNACQLHMAVQNGSVKEIFRVLDTGIDPNVTVSCCTPMMAVIWKSHGENSTGKPNQKEALCVLQCLLDGGASVNAASENGYTPLHTAAATDQNEIVSWLVQHGCDVNARTKDGRSALDLALDHGYLSTAAKLQGQGE